MTSPRSFRVLQLLATIAFAALASPCRTAESTSSAATGVSPPAVKYMDVDGARLPYVEQGSGTPVVFVHGSLADYRIWAPHLPIIASDGFRAVSYTQRYFGTEPWGDQWPPLSGQLHASDLASFLRALNAGPAHLVGWSYSGHIVLSVALDHPHLVKSVLVYEPIAPTYVTDPDGRKTFQENRGAILGPAAQSLKEGDDAEATRRLVDGVANKGTGYFNQQPQLAKDIQLDNARTLKPMFASQPPRQISCDELASIKPPAAIVQGASTTPSYKVVAETAARCMPASKQTVVPSVTHMWPVEDPAGFSSTLLRFLQEQSASR